MDGTFASELLCGLPHERGIGGPRCPEKNIGTFRGHERELGRLRCHKRGLDDLGTMNGESPGSDAAACSAYLSWTQDNHSLGLAPSTLGLSGNRVLR